MSVSMKEVTPTPFVIAPADAQAVEVSKGFSRPELLTLNGLYSATKTIYTTYVPGSAAKFIGGVSTTLFKASSPLVVKAIPESASAEWKSLENGEIEDIDKLLLSYFTSGDNVIDIFLNQNIDRTASIYISQKEKLTTKVDSWVDSVHNLKNFVLEKFHNVKPEVTNKIDEVKASVQATVQAKLEDEKVVALIDQATPYINLVKDNAEPAKDVISEMATTVKAEMDTKGYMGFAKESADSIREQGLEAIETCKTLGTVEGVKEISSQVINNVSTKLEAAKKRRAPTSAPPVISEPVAEAAPVAAAEEEEEQVEVPHFDIFESKEEDVKVPIKVHKAPIKKH